MLLFQNPRDFSPNFHTNHLAVDPSTEAEAQEKILQFFSQNKQIAPSPWSNPRSRILVRSKSKMAGSSDSPSSQSHQSTTSKTVWTQTCLSFPPILPPEVEEILSQYMINDPPDQTGHSPAASSNTTSEGDDSSLNASSLRRKLFTQMSTTPSTEEKSGSLRRARNSFSEEREHSSSPILTTGPHSSRFSFSPCSQPVSSPVLSPICSHHEDDDVEDEDNNVAMDEVTRQSWAGGGNGDMGRMPDRTVLMETYEAGYFSCSSNAAVQQSREAILEDESCCHAEASNLFTADKMGQPKECSTPTKTHPHHF